MNILFVTSNRVGDAVLSTGLLDHLIERYQGAKITVACGPAAVSLFAPCAGVSRVVPLAKRRYGAHWLRLWRTCFSSFWDIVVDLRGSALSWALLHRRHFVMRPSKAPVHRVVSLGRVLGLDDPPAPRVWVNRSHDEAASTLVPAKGALGLGPTANWGGKQWPAQCFGDLALRLVGTPPLRGAPIVLFGAPGEQHVARTLVDALSHCDVIDLIGKTDLPTAAACLRRCALFVGNDSGLMHLSAAAGTPTLGLFGPSPEVHYAPWGDHAGFVRTKESFEEIVTAPSYDYRSQVSLMDSLTVEAVATAAAELLGRSQAVSA